MNYLCSTWIRVPSCVRWLVAKASDVNAENKPWRRHTMKWVFHVNKVEQEEVWGFLTTSQKWYHRKSPHFQYVGSTSRWKHSAS